MKVLYFIPDFETCQFEASEEDDYFLSGDPYSEEELLQPDISLPTDWSKIKRKGVKSSNLRTVGYNPKSQEMIIEFKSGHIYKFLKIPKDIYKRLMRAPSKGRYFYYTIRMYPQKYPYQRLI